jgi:hypothetical protein
MEGVAWQEIRKLNIRTFKVSVVLWLFFQPQYIMAKSTGPPLPFLMCSTLVHSSGGFLPFGRVP